MLDRLLTIGCICTGLLFLTLALVAAFNGNPDEVTYLAWSILSFTVAKL